MDERHAPLHSPPPSTRSPLFTFLHARVRVSACAQPVVVVRVLPRPHGVWEAWTPLLYAA